MTSQQGELIGSAYYSRVCSLLLVALVCDVELCICHFSMWYSGSGVVLDCIDFGSLPLLLHCTKQYALSSIRFYDFTLKYSSSTKI